MEHRRGGSFPRILGQEADAGLALSAKNTERVFPLEAERVCRTYAGRNKQKLCLFAFRVL